MRISTGKLAGQLKNSVGASAESPIIRLTALFAGGNIISLILSMAAGLLVARFSEPEELGLFYSIGLIMGYLIFLQAGVSHAFTRQMPYLIGNGDQVAATQYAATAQAWAIFLGGVCTLALWGAAVWNAFHQQWLPAVGYLAFGFSAFEYFYDTQYLQITYRTNGDFPQLAKINIIKNATSLIASVLVYIFGFYGLCLRNVTVDFVNLFLHWRLRPMHIRPAWSWKRWLELLRIGIPLFLSSQVYAWWPVFNSTLVLNFLGTAPLGLNQVAVITGTGLELLYASLAQILYPRMCEDYGRQHNLSALMKMARQPILLIVILSVLIVAAGWWLLPIAVQWVLPKYAQAIPAAQWTLLASAVLAFQPLLNIFAVVNQVKLYFISVVSGMVVYYLLVKLFLQTSSDLSIFPQAMLVGRLTMTALALGLLVYLRYHPSLPQEAA